MVTMRFNLAYFDSRPIKRGLDRVTRSAMSHWGAIVRKTAQWSMKKKKGTSAPGKPPHAHAGRKGGKLRALLSYAYDPNDKSVVVGPERFQKGEAPSLQEGGGTAVRKITEGGRTRRKRVRYRPRPFMGPARDEGNRRLKECWIKARAKFAR